MLSLTISESRILEVEQQEPQKQKTAHKLTMRTGFQIDDIQSLRDSLSFILGA